MEKLYKFRGVSEYDGEMIVSQSIQYDEFGKCYQLMDEFGNWIYVHNVAQFIGYSTDNEDVYDDDKLVNIKTGQVADAIEVVQFGQNGKFYDWRLESWY